MKAFLEDPPEVASRGPLLHLRRMVVVAALVTMIVVIAILFPQIDRQLSRTALAENDDRTWGLAQLEVDLLRLQTALDSAMIGNAAPRDLDEVRLRFDILYSRVSVTESTEAAAPLVASPAWDRLAGPQGLVARLLPLVDGPDPALAAAVPDFRPELEEIAQAMRDEIVLALSAGLQQDLRQRSELRRMLQIFAGGIVGLLLMLSLVVALVLAQAARQARYARLLRTAYETLRETLQASLDAVVILDRAGTVIGANRSGRRLFGLPAEGRGPALRTLVAAEGTGAEDDLRARLRAAHATQERMRMRGRSADGGEFPIELNVAELQTGPEGPATIVFVRDISDQIEREANLERARNQALQAKEAKSRFLAVMSHEMRTPLHGLLSAVDLLQETTRLDPRQAWLTGILRSCAGTALDQVNNVLDITRLEQAEGPAFPDSVFDPVEVVRELVRQSMPEALRRGIALDLREPEAPVPPVLAPRPLFQRAIGNLLGNAVKFTCAGAVSVALEAEPAGDGRLRLRVRVRDTGPGIAPEDRDRIFENFESLDVSDTRRQSGSGLGLGIVRLSARAMGGRVTLESTPGEGSTFTFEVAPPLAPEPLAAPALPEDAPEDADAPTAEPLRLLVADDNAINRELLSQYLQLRGHAVREARDGTEAVALATAERFDAILMDIGMPGLDGMEATRRIRRRGASRRAAILAVTAQADEARRQEVLAAGMDEVAVKPVGTGELLRMIAAARVRPRVGRSAARPDPAPAAAEVEAQVLRDLAAQLGPEALEDILRRHEAEMDAGLAEIAALQDAGDLASAARVSHRLAGGAAVLGLARLQAACALHEAAATAGRAEEARQGLAEIGAAHSATLGRLRGLALS